jgi:hypothetical protein
VLPSGYSSLVGNKVLILSAFGSLGSYSANLTIDFGASVIDSRADDFPGGIKLFRRDFGSDGAWTLVGGAVSANSTTGVITWPGITTLGQFAAVYDETALPVELVSFNVSSRRLNAEIAWKTATEVNNHGFEIQRSEGRDQKSGSGLWTKVGFVEGNGTSNTTHEYSFTDRVVSAGTYAYRLKQIDRDGKFGYSTEVEVTVGSAPLTFALEQNYPNPFNPSTNIEFTVPVTGKASLKVYNIMGQEVATLFEGIAESGVFHRVTFRGSNNASGIYLCRLVSGNSAQVRKMLLTK